MPYYLFKQRIPFKGPRAVLELVIPNSKPEGNRDLFEDILHWEDDGGRVVEINHSTPEQFPIHHLYSISGSAYVRKRKKKNGQKSRLVD